MKLIVLTILVGFVHSDLSYTDSDSDGFVHFDSSYTDSDSDGFVDSDSSYTDSDSVNLVWTEISGPTPKSILKKNGTADRKPSRRLQFENVCTYSGFKLQPVKEIADLSLRLFLLTRKEKLAGTDCTLSYQVVNNDDGSSFSPFRIDHQNETSNSSVYGIVTVRGRGNFMWKTIKRRQFEHYLSKCDSKVGNEIEYPSLPSVLSCSQPGDILTSPAPQPSPYREVTPTTPSTSATTSQKITSTTTSSGIIHPRITPSTLAPQPISPKEVTPTIPPRGLTPEKSTTRKGLLNKLNCFKCF